MAERSPNPDHVQAIRELIAGSAFPALLSMDPVDIGMGYAVIQIDVQEKHRQLIGVVHGGVLASLIDTVAFWAVYYEVEDPEAWLVSVDLKLNYLAPTTGGRITGRGESKRIGARICYATAQATDENGRLLAHGAASLMIVAGGRPDRQNGFPPKFNN
jgi:uncharacterized protein (TIGR00369 family)